MLERDSYSKNLNKADVFWRKQGKGYKVFSAFCSPDDWQNIISKIALEISSSNPDSILDVGSGNGETILKVYKQIIQDQRKVLKFSLYEPSVDARDMGQYIFPEPLANWIGDIRNPKHKFDIITFVHSTYYIDLEWYLDFCIKTLLTNKGKIIFLSLSCDSPFFLNEKIKKCPWTAEGIIELLDKKGINYTVENLQSRIYIPEEYINNKDSLGALKAFIDTNDDLGIDDFKAYLKVRFANQTVDLKDKIITISPNIRG